MASKGRIDATFAYLCPLILNPRTELVQVWAVWCRRKPKIGTPKNENDNPNIETLLKVIEDEPNEQERKIMVYEKKNEILLPNV